MEFHSETDTNLRTDLHVHDSQSKIEELEQEKSELISKINQQRTEMVSLEIKNQDLEKQLNMCKLLSEQTPLDNSKDEKIELFLGEIATLSANVQTLKRERDQAKSDVIALRDTIMQNKQEAAREVKHMTYMYM